MSRTRMFTLHGLEALSDGSPELEFYTNYNMSNQSFYNTY